MIGAMRMKKPQKNMYHVFQKLGKYTMRLIFIVALIVGILFIGMATLIPELNRHTYEGVVVEKYRENHNLTSGTTQFIELKQGDQTIKIENNDILLHWKWNSKALQKEIQEGKKIKVYTIGFDVPSLGLHPNLYRFEQ